MKKLLLHTLIILAITALFNLLLRTTLSDYWAVNVLEEKVKCYEKISDQVETLFVGGSRTFFQFDPILYDSIQGNPSNTTYNFGTTGTSAPEIHAFINTILREHNVKHIVLEYGFYFGADYEWANATKSSYYWEPRLLKSILKIYHNNLKEYIAHLRLGWNNLTFLGYGKDVAASYILNNKRLIHDKIPLGFIINTLRTPINNDFKRCESNGYKPLVGLNSNWSASARTQWLDSKVRQALPLSDRNTISEKIYKEIESLCERNKVDITILFKPNDPWFEHSQLKNKISIGDNHSFPEYFLDESWHDRFHLNSTGSQAYTRRIAHILNNHNL